MFFVRPIRNERKSCMNAKNKVFGPLLLVLAAMIWGLSFVAQNEGMNHVEAFTFNGIRMLIGSAVLVPFILIKRKKNPQKLTKNEKKFLSKTALIAIIPVGICLFLGSTLQQFAFNYTETGKIGFLTALYMIFVPVIGLFMKKKTPFTVWIGVLLGVIGMYLLCVGASKSFTIGKGELLGIGCAIAYAVHIIVIDKLGKNVDSLVLSCGQFFITGIISCILMFIFEKPSIERILDAAIPILYSGVLSSGVGFTIQIVGQKYTEPTIAAMLFCLESVFAVLFAFIIPPHEKLATVEYIGCTIIFLAIVIAQLNPKKKA